MTGERVSGSSGAASRHWSPLTEKVGCGGAAGVLIGVVATVVALCYLPRPALLIALGATATVAVVTVALVHVIESARGAGGEVGVVPVLAGAAVVELLVVAGLSLFHQPWRAVAAATLVVVVGALWMLASCASAVRWWRRRGATAGVAVVALATVIFAAMLPVAVAAAIGLPPVRQVTTPAGWWWALVVAGVIASLGIIAMQDTEDPTKVPAPVAYLPISAGQFWVGPPPPPPSWSARKFTVSPSPMVRRALAAAAAELPDGERLTTGRLLGALERVDVHVSWPRIWLHTGGFDPRSLDTAPDPSNQLPLPPTWEGVPLSDRVARALDLAQQIGTRYNRPAGSTGVLALGLLAYRGSGATEAILAGGGLTHRSLLRRVQTDILGATLLDVGSLIPAARD